MKKIVLGLIVMVGFIPFSYAAQLDAALLEGHEKTQPTFEFLRVIYIEYPEGGKFAEFLRGEKKEILFTADSSTPGMKKFISDLNQNLKAIPSQARISDAKIDYQVILQGNEKNTVIEIKLVLTPTIENHILFNESERSSIDSNWRGISISTPVLMETPFGELDINNPKSSLSILIPELSEQLNTKILEMPVIDASGIINFPMHRWHYLFDNTAIMEGPKAYNYSGKFVITTYSMGQCSLFDGTCEDKEWSEKLNLDKNYLVRIIESRDDATILVEGYTELTTINGIEIIQTNLHNPINPTPDSDNSLSNIMYGMAGIAIIGAVAMFAMSNKKLKNEQNQGQTGIDPSDLKSYETSISSGGYRTNRGESYIISKNFSKTAI